MPQLDKGPTDSCRWATYPDARCGCNGSYCVCEESAAKRPGRPSKCRGFIVSVHVHPGIACVVRCKLHMIRTQARNITSFAKRCVMCTTQATRGTNQNGIDSVWCCQVLPQLSRAAAVAVTHNSAAGSPRRPSPPRLRCLRSNERRRGSHC